MSKPSRIVCSIDLNAPGKQQGELLLRYSDNNQPLGYYPIPIISITGGDGPTALLIAGVHGDEFEGPTALMRLVNQLSSNEVKGRIIILPCVNQPAIAESSRVSLVDGINMNRAFPGDADGTPTQMLAHYVETVLMPLADLAIDIHTGGKASIFTSCTLVSRTSDQGLFNKNMALAKAFGLPLIWLLGEFNDDRSVNSAALRNQVPMIAAELGGGGGNDPDQVNIAENGVRQCLSWAGILGDELNSAQQPRLVEINSSFENLYAPLSGLFDRRFKAGDEVGQGQLAGLIYPSESCASEPVKLDFPRSGLVLAHGNWGNVKHGDMLAMVASNVEDIE